MSGKSKKGLWASYDSDGNRVPSRSKLVAFRAYVVTHAPSADRVGKIEFTAHSITRPELERTFKSFGRMQAWFRATGSAAAKG